MMDGDKVCVVSESTLRHLLDMTKGQPERVPTFIIEMIAKCQPESWWIGRYWRDHDLDRLVTLAAGYLMFFSQVSIPNASVKDVAKSSEMLLAELKARVQK